MKRFGKVTVIALVSLCMALVLAATSFAADLKDVKGHWAEEYIEYGIEKGYISGYAEDNTFRPDNTVTRAEFSKMLNNAVKITATSAVNFSDVKKSDWYYAELQKASYAGYIAGYTDGTFKPNGNITRQEAAVVLSRIVTPTTQRASVADFKDGTKIASWASDAVKMIAAKGYIKGDENANFIPEGNLTRAQAAKLICEFVKNEKIVNGVYSINKETTLSETLFTDGVVFKAGENDGVVFENVRVLGSVNVQSDEAVVELRNSVVAELKNNGGDKTSVSADNDSKVAEVVAYYPMGLSGDVFEKVVLSGGELDGDTITLSGKFALVEVSSDVTLKVTGTVEKLNVLTKSNVSIQAGKVTEIEVNKNAKNSVITLAKNVKVETATNNAEVSYLGDGTITKANNTVKGVTFETAPSKVVGEKAGEADDKDEDKDDEDEDEDEFFADVTFSPTKGKTKVSPYTSIVLTFDEKLYDEDEKNIDSDYVEENLELRKKTSTGTKVDFSATYSATTKKITIIPDDDLDEGIKYYVVIPKDTLYYKDGSSNEKLATYYFTTAGSSSGGAGGGSSSSDDDDDDDEDVSSIVPKNGAEDVEVDTDITIKFAYKLYDKKGNEADEDYLIDEEVFSIHEGSKTGDEIDFDLELDSTGKKVTLTPEDDLKDGEDYYVIIKSGVIENKSGSSVPKKTFSFTTEGAEKITMFPADGATNISLNPEIVITFKEDMLDDDEDEVSEEYIEDILTLKQGTKTIDYAVDIVDAAKWVITPDELDENKTYTLTIKAKKLIGADSETKNELFTSKFTTAGKLVPVVYPAEGETGVPTSAKIKVSFIDTVYSDKDKGEVTEDYLTDGDGYSDETSDPITLRKTKATGTVVKCTVEIEDDGKTIVLVPDEALEKDAKYCVVIKSKAFYNKSGTAGASYSGIFDTNGAFKATFSPKDDAKNVDIDSKLTVTFNDTVCNAEGDEYDKSDLEELVALYEGKDDKGDAVEFELSLNSAGTKLTVTPKEDLKGSTFYTLVLSGDSMYNEDGEALGAQAITFKTEVYVDDEIEVDPESGEKNIAVDATPTITFGSPIFDDDGDSVTSKYATKYIYLSTSSTSKGDIEDYTVEVNEDGTQFKIVPDKNLERSKKYYIIIDKDRFFYEDETDISESDDFKSSWNFTTVAPEIEIKEVVAEEGSVSVTFETDCDGEVGATVTLKGKTTSIAKATADEYEAGEYTITIEDEDLVAGKEYTVKLAFEDEDGAKATDTDNFSIEEEEAE